MKLRARLWLLIASLLLAVHSGGFLWLSSNLSRQVKKDLETSLDASESAFRAAEQQRFKILEVMAQGLESSPSFRNVFRRTDQLTLSDYLQARALGLDVDLVLVAESTSEIRGDSRLKEQEVGPHPDWEALEEWGGQTPSLPSYWSLDGQLYQAATVVLADSQGYIDGFISVAYRLDREFLDRESQSLGANLGLEAGTDRTLNLFGLESQELKKALWRKLPLSGEGSEAVAYLLVSKSTQPLETLLREARWKLAGFALLAFCLALAVSLPFVGQLADPVEALERAQKEMEAISSSSLDGLLSLDEEGRVKMANPAAGVALGRDHDTLVGTSVEDLLPEGVLTCLLSAPPGIHQEAEFRRSGQTYRVYRTYLRQASKAQLESILVFHNRTQTRDTERQVRAFLHHLCQNLGNPQSPWPIRVGLATLTQWARLDLDETPTMVNQIDLTAKVRECVGEFNRTLAEENPCQLRAPESLLIEGDSTELTVVLEALLDNAFRHGEGEISVTLTRVGGAAELLVANSGEGPENLELALDGPGLGLKVVKTLVERHLGQLSLLKASPDSPKPLGDHGPHTTFKVSFPLSARKPA